MNDQNDNDKRSNSPTRLYISEKIRQFREELAYCDELTGLFNYRLLSFILDEWWLELIRHEDQLSLIIIDLDGFKDVNDKYGHLTGDRVLKIIADVLQQHFRADDILIRYGGDEFVMLLPGVATAEAAEICQRARQALSNHTFTSEYKNETVEVPLSFSMGVASFPADSTTGRDLLHIADCRLYEDKKNRYEQILSANKKVRKERLELMFLLVLTMVGGLVFSGLGQRLFSPGPPLNRTPALVSSPPLSSAPDWLQREEALLLKIEALQKQVEQMSPAADDDSPREDLTQMTYVASLEVEIANLQHQLERQARQQALQANATNTRPQIPSTAETEFFQSVTPLSEDPAPDDLTPTPTIDPIPTSFIETRPIRKSLPPYNYPQIAKRLRREADVQLKLLVGVDGRVLKADIIGPAAGFGFDDEAIRIARLARYEPGTRNGSPVPMETFLTIQFSLSDTE